MLKVFSISKQLFIQPLQILRFKVLAIIIYNFLQQKVNPHVLMDIIFINDLID